MGPRERADPSHRLLILRRVALIKTTLKARHQARFVADDEIARQFRLCSQISQTIIRRTTAWLNGTTHRSDNELLCPSVYTYVCAASLRLRFRGK